MNKNNQKLLFGIVIFLGLLLISYAIIITFISPEFTYAVRPTKQELFFYILLRIFIGIAYFVSVVIILRKISFSKKTLGVILIAGIITRLILVPSEPILEDDYNRYLWDGAVTANGINPFEYPPELILSKKSKDSSVPDILFELADSSGVIFERINHPHIRTIYPPLAQGAFALSYFINPWNTTTWKFILLLIDFVVVFLIILLLRKLKLSLFFVVVYWWNPILLHEIFNAGHMDIVLYPFILLGMLFIVQNKYVSSVVSFSLAVGGKIWPVIFIPFVFQKVFRNKKLLIILIVLSASIITLLLFPILLTKIDNSLGFVTYTKNWTNNESVFQLLNLFVKEIIQIFKINYSCSLCVARWITFIFFSFVLTFFIVKKKGNALSLFNYFYLSVAIMYIISPTQFPWYYTWVLPFLAINPRLSFVLYAAFLPLYQLKYSYPYLVWIEHIPIIALFTIEIFNRRVGKYLSVG